MNRLNERAQDAESHSTQNTQGGLLIGKITALNDQGNPMIAYDEQTKRSPVEALTTVPLTSASIGQEVAISFAQNRGGTPIVMGVIRRMLDDVLNLNTSMNAPETAEVPDTQSIKPEILVDGNKLALSAAEEITLRCGKASITLTKAGKILIKGEHMLNRTSGAYKVKSGSIQLN
jgi:hypothetical protein